MASRSESKAARRIAMNDDLASIRPRRMRLRSYPDPHPRTSNSVADRVISAFYDASPHRKARREKELQPMARAREWRGRFRADHH
jgi:hypothetical protein